MKICSVCKLEKPDEDFRPRRRQCFQCLASIRREDYASNAPQKREAARSRYRKCRDLGLRCVYSDRWQQRASSRRYRERHPDRVAAYKRLAQDKTREWRREYGVLNKAHIAEQRKVYRIKNSDELSRKNMEYKAKNKAKILEYARRRKRTNLAVRIVGNLRSRIKNVLIRGSKTFHTIEVLGCTAQELKHHLESQFQDGMSWENYGKFGWHIDHIRPCASFDLTDPEQQKQCFHYSNLQPLWWRDNLSKGSCGYRYANKN